MYYIANAVLYKMGYKIGEKISHKITADAGKLSWYHDPLPTNCVGDWVCAGGTGAGFPDYANCPGPERGYKNLAVFFHACSFNCLYCQNWQFRKETTYAYEKNENEFHPDD